MKNLAIILFTLSTAAFIACQKEPSTTPTINRSPTGDLIAKMTYSDSNNNALLEQRFIYDASAQLKVIRTREVYLGPTLMGDIYVDSFFRNASGRIIGHSGRLVDSTTLLGNPIDNIVHTVYYIPNSNNIDYIISYTANGMPFNTRGKDSITFTYSTDGRVKEILQFSNTPGTPIYLYTKKEYIYDATGNTISYKTFTKNAIADPFVLKIEELYSQFDMNRKYIDDFSFLENFLRRKYTLNPLCKNMLTKSNNTDYYFSIVTNSTLQNYYNSNNRPDSCLILSNSTTTSSKNKLRCYYQ
jgi:hypothetical protein